MPGLGRAVLDVRSRTWGLGLGVSDLGSQPQKPAQNIAMTGEVGRGCANQRRRSYRPRQNPVMIAEVGRGYVDAMPPVVPATTMIFRAPENPLTIPDVALTPFLLERAASLGEKPAMIDSSNGRVVTYAGWADGVRRAAGALARRGLRKGDVVGIYSGNCPDYAVAFHAVSLLGGIITTINPLYTAEELRRQLTDAGATYLITAPPFLSSAVEAAKELDLFEIFVFGEGAGATPFDSLLSGGGDVPVVTIDPRNDVVALPYSSGTTGLPKGVMLTHRNLVANILQCEAVFGLVEDDVTLGVLPFFHIYGLVVVMNLSFRVGATLVTMPRFDLQQCLRTLETHRVTYAYVVPPIVLAFARSPLVGNYDLGALRVLFSGAAPLSAEVAEAAGRRLGCSITQGYGMTEASPATHVTRVGKTVGVGQPMPDTESKIVDLVTGAELGSNAEGEICVRGPQVMKGYLNRPDATAAMIDSEGWLHTGDIGYADGRGCFFVVDRVKELIKYKGLQIAPAELEALLLTHPCVADAAVVPIADEEAGQVPKAFVVLRAETTPEEIQSFVACHVAPYKKLRYVEVIEAIPRSPSGKILRRVLAART
jgi:acyl-CoA synthetase (AMP-forming)/AMP-acid ligase II